ncbi:MAG: hypothetical protein KUF77_13620 [Candidatus Thiodiazotropha sp. (ex Lucina aurantia)]|nr:hypothetical protein [Candidatus Thiodiazotropha sp. (ex Lucina pensylvanica)]MBT3024398.1 hypothetical protein [Candidatus Thiodiazotropha taylori]MBT3055899.1 hypothetical protein [Candidatus Thiodiazotropha sp. (ex Codakia orbicularis)]MBV2104058.1 hypothetical protein [Candidatus Thiodiazotropha sp. (ex Lucina aurantia)]MBV2099300.1 hypothetical protein [Candidatus Thiodiazotropha sp. (ex Codakia orbicularis)]
MDTQNIDTGETNPGSSRSTDKPVAKMESIPNAFRIEHTTRNPELIAEILLYPEGSIRDDFLETCLRIGALALKQAEGQIDAQAVRKEGEQLMDQMDRALSRHRETVMDQIGNTLTSYFDPESGRLEERLNRLLKRDGELEEILRRQVGGGDSEIAKTLTAHIGESSPLLKMIDPKSTDGIVYSMEDTIKQALQADSERILQEFSMDAEGSALNRFAKYLAETNKTFSGGLQENINIILKEFSLDHEDSALSRLVGQVSEAQKTISAEFSLDSETSALAKMQKHLVHLVEQGHEKNRVMLTEIHGLVKSLHVRREEVARSTTHGNEFESALFNLIDDLAQKAGDMATATGNTTGTIRNCKKGDIVVQIGPEHVASSANIVFEAKEDQSYTIQSALDEIHEARKNRNAEIGVFVFSSKVAPEGLIDLQRYGNDLLVIWDYENPDTDLFPRMALTVAKALCTQGVSEKASTSIDLEGINEAIRSLEKQIEGFNEIKTSATSVQKSGEKIFDRARIMQSRMNRDIEALDEYQSELKKLD